MLKGRSELTALLDQLDADLDKMVIENPGDELWPVFGGQADFIEDHAGSADAAYVASRLDAMLKRHGLEI